MPASALYLVRVHDGETALREQIKTARGRWNPEQKLWLVTPPHCELRLEDRIVTSLPSTE